MIFVSCRFTGHFFLCPKLAPRYVSFEDDSGGGAVRVLMDTLFIVNRYVSAVLCGIADKFGVVDKLGVADKLEAVDKLGVADKLGTVDKLGVADKLGAVDKLAAADKLGAADALAVDSNLVERDIVVDCNYNRIAVWFFRILNS